MYDIDTVRRINIGRRIENLVTPIVFDVHAWMEKLPGAVYTLRYIRPGENTVYQPEIMLDEDEGSLTWIVTNSDTYIDGTGTCEVWAEVAETGALRRSQKILCIVDEGMRWYGEEDPEAPDPLKGWADRLMHYESDVKQAINNSYASAQVIINMANDITQREQLRVSEPEDGYVELTGGYDGTKAGQPVGSYWITEADINPAALYGGEWEEVTDKVLLGSGGRSVGSTGGNGSFMLSMDQLPEEVHG